MGVTFLIEEIYRRVSLSSVREPGKSEKGGKKGKKKGGREMRTLPLKDHSLEFVVQYENFDTNIILRSSSEFHSGHGEGSVSIDIDDDLLRCSYFRSDRRR